MKKRIIIAGLGLLLVVALVGGFGIAMGKKANKTEPQVQSNPEKITILGVGGPGGDLPTVEELLNKVKENYSKIKDLKADMVLKVEKKGGWGYPILKDRIVREGMVYFFKAPDKMKFSIPKDERSMIIKDQTEHLVGGGEDIWSGEIIKKSSSKLAWYFILDPWHLPFYYRLDELLTKFDCVVKENPEPNIYVIEAVPKGTNPDDEYNYPLPGGVIKFFIDYEKGIIKEFDDYGPLHDGITNKAHTLCQLQNFSLLNEAWIPAKFIKTIFSKKGDVKTTEEINLTNIQLNTGIPDSEFEFE